MLGADGERLIGYGACVNRPRWVFIALNTLVIQKRNVAGAPPLMPRPDGSRGTRHQVGRNLRLKYQHGLHEMMILTPSSRAGHQHAIRNGEELKSRFIVMISFLVALSTSCGADKADKYASANSYSLEQSRSSLSDRSADSSHPQSNRGRTVAPGDFLASVYISGRSQLSGTLIGRRTVLTAAHVAIEIGDPVYFGNASPYLDDRAVVASARLNETDYEPGDEGNLQNTGLYDIQVLMLDSEVKSVGGYKIMPAILNWDAAQVTVGPLNTRHVGFGEPSPGGGKGTKREIITDTDWVSANKFEYANNGGSPGVWQQVCFGDSGGSGFRMISGVEKLVGVVNAGDSGCVKEAYDTRVDRPDIRAFIQAKLNEYDDCSWGNINC